MSLHLSILIIELLSIFQNYSFKWKRVDVAIKNLNYFKEVSIHKQFIFVSFFWLMNYLLYIQMSTSYLLFCVLFNSGFVQYNLQHASSMKFTVYWDGSSKYVYLNISLIRNPDSEKFPLLLCPYHKAQLLYCGNFISPLCLGT